MGGKRKKKDDGRDIWERKRKWRKEVGKKKGIYGSNG